MQETIFITGGAGYLGCLLVPELLKRGEVFVVDNLYFGKKPLSNFIGHSNFKLISEDIYNLSAYEDQLAKIDTVVHLAGLANDPSADLDPSLTIRSNVVATLNLARKAKELGVKRFINISSCSVYGASGGQLVDESTLPEPVTLYALSKFVCDQELDKLASDQFCLTSLRLATLFGYSPRMRFDLVVNTMTKTALTGKDLVINGSGEQYRPFLHVADAADAILHMIEIEQGKISGEIFNIGNNKLNYTIKDLAEMIVQFFPGRGTIVMKDNVDTRSYNVDFSKLERQTGFLPKREIGFGVKEIIEHCERGEFPSVQDSKYYNFLTVKNVHTDSLIPYSTASKPDHALPETGPDKLLNKRPKIVGMILAYNVGPMIRAAYKKIPKGILDDLYVMDNGTDNGETRKIAEEIGLKVYHNDTKAGYGGNVKEGLKRGLTLDADYIVEIHGDGAQFNPKSIKYAIPYMEEGIDFILGSRFQNPKLARKNGMPLIRYIANRGLSFIDKAVLRVPFTEFHTGFVIYGREFLKKVPFEKNSDDHLFSFQIIAQAAFFKCTTAEVPVEADYLGKHTSLKLSRAALYAFQNIRVCGEFLLAKWFSKKQDIFDVKNLTKIANTKKDEL